MYKIIANWKMYLSIRDSRELAAKLVKWWKETPCVNVDVVLCPSDIAMRDVADQVLTSGIKLGGQSLSLSAGLGAFTGQSAAQQLQEAGAEYVILGHSEQRRFLGVTDRMVRQQVQVAMQHRLHPIVCVGETEEERKSGRADAVVVSQLHAIFEQLSWPTTGLSVAYEPVWAIGTGKPVDPKEAQRMHVLIKHTLQEFFGSMRAQDTSVLYGGSVNPDNMGSFLQEKAVSGLLVGSASTNPDTLHALITGIQNDFCKRPL